MSVSYVSPTARDHEFLGAGEKLIGDGDPKTKFSEIISTPISLRDVVARSQLLNLIT